MTATGQLERPQRLQRLDDWKPPISPLALSRWEWLVRRLLILAKAAKGLGLGWCSWGSWGSSQLPLCSIPFPSSLTWYPSRSWGWQLWGETSSAPPSWVLDLYLASDGSSTPVVQGLELQTQTLYVNSHRVDRLGKILPSQVLRGMGQGGPRCHQLQPGALPPAPPLTFSAAFSLPPPHLPCPPLPTLFPPAFLPTCGLLLLGCLLCFLLSSLCGLWSPLLPAGWLISLGLSLTTYHPASPVLCWLASPLLPLALFCLPLSWAAPFPQMPPALSLFPQRVSYSSYSYPVFLRGAS